MIKIKYLLPLLVVISCSTSKMPKGTKSANYNEPHRPQIHFSPKAKWMNDPNGMVFFNNRYHLFYQYFPDSTIWGPMHWGHATSKDLVHWTHQPVALYPDSLGYIFSGSAVADVNNTSGFGAGGKIPLVAIFTHHDPKGEQAGSDTYQNQSIAYSLDGGQTWTKYANNPVLKNPGIKDFRDPKVSWYEAGKKWIMTLATLDRITFYSSPNLKDWTKESEFGKELGAHGGVWECPDLFPLDYNGRQTWVLLVSINPGGPNGGSATQYFTGQFDGNKFTPDQTGTRWIDYGADNYAGITWSNTGNRKIFLGWMSNWLYANVVPTEAWRNAATIPRELTLKKSGNEMLVASEPVQELTGLQSRPVVLDSITVSGNADLSAKLGGVKLPGRINLHMDEVKNFSILLSNGLGETVSIGFDKTKNQYFVDRTRSGNVGFQKDFPARHIAPRLATDNQMDLSLVLDNSSVELFADEGLTVMTEIFFPSKPYNLIHIQSADNLLVKKLEYVNLKGIW